MKKINWLLGILFSVACGPSAWAQPVPVTWPLTSGNMALNGYGLSVRCLKDY